MSGFLSILDIDAQPIDRELLQRMTCSLVIQKADALDTWSLFYILIKFGVKIA